MAPVAYLSIGSNLDNPESSVKEAIEKLLNEKGVKLKGLGKMYETEPQGKPDQPWFVNTALALYVDFSPEETLKKTKEIENEMGRRPSGKWGPRKIDIDIIFFDDLILDSGELTIPHPLAGQRRFVLKPLCDIDPQLVHPKLGKSVARLLEELPEEGQRMREIEQREI